VKRLPSDDQHLSTRSGRAILVLIAVVSLVAGALGVFGIPGLPGKSAHAAGSLPCDIYAAGGTPCAAAHSTIRALFASYNGPLYQIQRASDGQYLDIGLLAPGGYANAAAQVSFCANTTCTITKIYDQTSNHNDLPISWGGYWKGPGPNGSDIGANAMALPITVAGHQVYGVKVTQGVGYRIDNARGVATGSQPEGIYMVTSSSYVDQWCCFDYGSGETNHVDDGNATMNAIEWGTACWFGGCVGSGPWVEADLENGMYSSTAGPSQGNYTGVNFPFVSAFEKNNGTSNFTLKYGNSQTGGLTTPFSGALPNGYSPMKLQNSILLGTGGDNSNSGVGEFFEGAVTAGYPSDATENAVQAAIVSAGYGNGGGSTTYYHLVNRNSGLVMDVNGASTSAGANVIQWPNNGGFNQEWSLQPTGDGYYYLVNRNSGLVMDVNGASTSQGASVIQWSNHGGTNQQWSLQSTGDGYYRLVNRNSGLVADVNGASTSQGAQVIQWPNNGGYNQEWSLVAV
jgi:hypothetical protein